MKIIKPVLFHLGVAAMATAFFAGCMSTQVNECSCLNSPFTRMPLDSLQNVVQLLPYQGKLLLANRSAKDPGLAVVDTVTGKIEAYYTETLPPSGLALVGNRYLFSTETDYSQGAVQVADLQEKTLTNAFPFGKDNALDTADGKVFLFDHATGVVTGFTGNTPGQNVVFNAQMGDNSNPYDIAITGSKAFVARYDMKSLLILDAGTLDGGSRDSIDLGDYSSKIPADSAASAPRMAFTTGYNGYVFVALQRLNYNYQPLDTSLVVVINAATRKVETVIALHFRNPISAHAVNGIWYLTGISGYGDTAGGVEKIDLAQRKHAGDVVTEQSLDADVFDFVPTSDHEGFVVTSSDYGVTTKVKKVSL